MTRTTVSIDGMKCSMCEAHVSELIKRHIDGAIVVKASHSKNNVVILSERSIKSDELKSALSGFGYRMQDFKEEMGLKDTLSFLFHKKHYRFYR